MFGIKNPRSICFWFWSLHLHRIHFSWWLLHWLQNWCGRDRWISLRSYSCLYKTSSAFSRASRQFSIVLHTSYPGWLGCRLEYLWSWDYEWHEGFCGKWFSSYKNDKFIRNLPFHQALTSKQGFIDYRRLKVKVRVVFTRIMISHALASKSVVRKVSRLKISIHLCWYA